MSAILPPFLALDQRRDLLPPDMRQLHDYLRRVEPRATRGLTVNLWNVGNALLVFGTAHALNVGKLHPFLGSASIGGVCLGLAFAGAAAVHWAILPSRPLPPWANTNSPNNVV